MVMKSIVITALAVLFVIHSVSCNVETSTVAIQLAEEDLPIPAPECSLPREDGNCTKSLQRYYFDDRLGRCQSFNYTGCDGNLNNFKNFEHCNRRCVCSNPKDVGTGSIRVTRYYFNHKTNKCETFRYRGSGGNTNRFLSRSECQNTCESIVIKESCAVRPDVGNLCNDTSSTKFYYDKLCNCCRPFTYLGCGGNENKFGTRKECKRTCKKRNPATPIPPTRPPKPAICFFQNVYGDCSSLLTRYYYNNKLKRCIPFTYSGCGGNENNFLTFKMCRKSCEE